MLVNQKLQDAAADREKVARSLAKGLARRLRKEFPNRKVSVVQGGFREGRQVVLEVFPKSIKEGHGRVEFSVLDANGHYDYVHSVRSGSRTRRVDSWAAPATG